MKWFRLYSEARNDAKLRHLADDEHRVWFNLMCFANEQKDNRGSIPYHSYTLLAIEVANGDDELLQRTLEKLVMLRIIEDIDGTIFFINFGKRQYDNPSDEPEEVRKRVQKHRSKKCNDSVTTMKREETIHNTDTDTDTEIKEKEMPAASSEEKEILRILRSVDSYPFDYEKDLNMVRMLVLDFPKVNILLEIKKWRDYKMDKPLKNKSSPRLQLRNWMIKGQEFLNEGSVKGGANKGATEADKKQPGKYMRVMPGGRG